MRIYTCLLIGLIAVALPRQSYAQSAEEPQISAQFASLLWLNGLPKSSALRQQRPELYYRSGTEYEKLNYQSNQIGNVQKYRGIPQIILYRRTTNPQGEVVFTPVGSSTSLPLNTTEFMLFIQPTDAAGNVRVSAINTSSEYIRNGTMLFANLSAYDMVTQIGEERVSLKPGQTNFFEPDFEEGQADIPVQVAIFDQKKDKWKRAYSSKTRMLSHRPYLGIFYLSGNRPNAYRFRMFTDLYLLRGAPAEESVE